MRRKTTSKGLPQTGNEIPPGPQPGQQRSRREIQRKSKKPTKSSRQPKTRRLRPIQPRWRRPQRRRCFGASSAGFGNFGDAFADIFGDIFGGRAGQGGSQRSNVYRGADLRYNMEITLEEAARLRKQVRIPAVETTDTCHGSGARHRTENLPNLRRPRPSAHAARLFQHPANLPHLPRHRQKSSPNPAMCAAAAAR